VRKVWVDAAGRGDRCEEMVFIQEEEEESGEEVDGSGMAQVEGEVEVAGGAACSAGNRFSMLVGIQGVRWSPEQIMTTSHSWSVETSVSRLSVATMCPPPCRRRTLLTMVLQRM